MDFIVTGQITQIFQAQQGVSQRSGQPWVSQEFQLTYEQGQYPKSLIFRVFGQDKLQQMAIQNGETITVHLNIVAQQSQSNGRFFNDISCWKVERQVQQQAVPQQQYQQPVQQMQQPQYQQAPVQTPFPQQQMPPQQPAPGAAPYPPQQPQAPEGKLPF